MQSYNLLYDQMVLGIRRIADPKHNIKFAGLAFGGWNNEDWYAYFLNHSNHAPDIPLDIMSFHFYGSCQNRTDPVNYQNFFEQADELVAEVRKSS